MTTIVRDEKGTRFGPNVGSANLKNSFKKEIIAGSNTVSQELSQVKRDLQTLKETSSFHGNTVQDCSSHFTCEIGPYETITLSFDAPFGLRPNLSYILQADDNYGKLIHYLRSYNDSTRAPSEGRIVPQNGTTRLCRIQILVQNDSQYQRSLTVHI